MDSSNSLKSPSSKTPNASKKCPTSQDAPNESAALLAKAEQMAHLGSWQIDVITNKVLWSKELFRIFGLQPQTYGLSIEDYQKFIHPDDADFVIKTMTQLIASGNLNEMISIDYRIILGDGSMRILHSERAVKEVNGNGKPKLIVGIEQDVTERKKAEEALKESEERFRFVAEAANVMVYETDVITGKIKIFRGSEELVGYKPNEIDFTVDWVLNRMHPDDAPNVLAQLKSTIENQNLEKYSLEYRFLHKNGQYITVKDTAKAVRDSAGKTIYFIGGIRDITQRKKDKERIEQHSKHLERLVEERTKQLINSERFVAIGQTAGMVGHDIRNPLQAIVSSAYLAKSDLETLPDSIDKDNALEELKYIEEQTTYIDKIVKDLQDYSKQLNPELTEVNITVLVASCLATVHIPTNIDASMEIEPEISKLNLDPLFFRRTMINLVTNAIQAMPNGGKLTVRGFKKENKAYISVEDNGVGIPEEVKPKLFTPMVTTKAKGQGLGLAVVKRLVEAQGGTINFESEIGSGTKFIIEFPLEEAKK
ncbi:PAS domain-containing protein [Candidatus Bathyarchaeota archaeon]|nr:PAS domain-containing protein [Candidatus Bathyarchaeota archaeon]